MEVSNLPSSGWKWLVFTHNFTTPGSWLTFLKVLHGQQAQYFFKHTKWLHSLSHSLLSTVSKSWVKSQVQIGFITGKIIGHYSWQPCQPVKINFHKSRTTFCNKVLGSWTRSISLIIYALFFKHFTDFLAAVTWFLFSMGLVLSIGLGKFEIRWFYRLHLLLSTFKYFDWVHTFILGRCNRWKILCF